jgi:hypothetical protein
LAHRHTVVLVVGIGVDLAVGDLVVGSVEEEAAAAEEQEEDFRKEQV